MSDLREQLAALDELYGLYFSGTRTSYYRRRVAWKTTLAPTNPPDFDATEAEFTAQFDKECRKARARSNSIVRAIRRLAASGYDVPEHWIDVQSVNQPEMKMTGPIGTSSGTTNVLATDQCKVVLVGLKVAHLKQVCAEIRLAKKSLKARAKRYLGITVDEVERTVSRDGYGRVEFSQKKKPWKLFGILLDAREKGIPVRDFKDEIGSSLYTHKATLLDVISPLKLDVKLDGGNWRLCSMW
jgi:hypothetical protein